MSSKHVIGIVAPSSPVPDGLVDQSITYFENLGFKVKTGKHLDKNELFTAGTDEERASDIMDFIKDPEVSVIITTNGGTCSIRTLPLLDYGMITQNPKLIVGYSDATALQLGIYAKTGALSLTGFNCSDIKNGTVAKNTWTSFLHCLNKESYSVNGGETVCHGTVTAPVIGGNLSCLLNLMGTPYQPDFSGKILLIEDVGIEPYLIEGMFSQLHVAGVLDNVAGIVIGHFTECTAKHFDSKDVTTEDVIDFWCKRIKVPCIKNFPYDHIENRYVLPLGQIITLDASNCRLDINFPWINAKSNDPILLNLDNGQYQLQNSTNDAYEYILAESLAFDERVLPFTQKPKRIEINFIINNEGNVVGGIYADLYHWNILYICILFVAEAHRNKNLGSILLTQVEEKARSMGSTLSHVETYDFQAKDFYIKQGYEICGVLDDCPPGHKRYYLKKNLAW